MARTRSDLHRELVALAPALRRFAYALTRHVADADDLVQAALERLLAKPPPEDVNVQRWSYTVCRNIWIDEVRARKVRREASPELSMEPAETASAEEAASSRMLLEKARMAMNALPDEQREVIALVAIGGMAYRDAADVIGAPIGTVMSRLARARTALAANLEAGT
jgi:RNA polymerase sigma factor (sigma-70 family)